MNLHFIYIGSCFSNVNFAIIGSTVELFTADEEIFTGIFFQDYQMKFNFASYPEVLMIDATYKLNDLRMPLYLMLIVDSNGQSEIVATLIPNSFRD